MAQTIKYESKRSEIWKWYWQNWKAKLWRFHVLIFTGVTFIMLIVLTFGRQPSLLNLFIALSCGALSIVWLPIFPILAFKPQMRTLTVEDSGVSTSIGTKSKVYEWKEFSRVTDENGTIVISLKNLNSFIVPQRAFETDLSRIAFLNFVKNRI